MTKNNDLSTGYTWAEAPENLKISAMELARGLDITPLEAYQLMLEKLTPEHFKN
tara:strand:- start:336 stop:497 length:162 start_codon:yes stop_codon:yes gene_type:complete